MHMDREKVFGLVSTAAAIGVAMLVRKSLRGAYERRTHHEPPENPAAPGVTWGQAALWAGATGAIIGIARVAAQRIATGGWERVTHEPAPVRR